MATILLLFLLVAVAVARFFGLWPLAGKSRNLPPGPSPLPILGSIIEYRKERLYHMVFAKLANIYGPLMLLKLGHRNIVVVSSPDVAREIFQKFDTSFTSRIKLDASRAQGHNNHSIGWLPAGRKWRNIRKMYKEQIFSSQPLNASQGTRQEKVKQLCDYVREHSIRGQSMSIYAAAFTTSLVFLSNILFSTDIAYLDSNSSKEIDEILSSLTITMAKPNLADFFPWLKIIDPQGVRRQTEFYMEKLFETFEHIIEQRLQERKVPSTMLPRKNDLIEVFLDLYQHHEDEWSYNDIKHILLDLFIGATTSIAATVEWAMAELLRNPNKKEKVRAEIKQVVGQNKLVDIQESDISGLSYLHAVFKETLRLHPPNPLIPRVPDEDIAVGKYIVPKNSTIIANIWGMGRDPKLWANPHSFEPERFLESKINYKGQQFEFFPFGSGRRACIGIGMAERMVHLMLASLLNDFDWKLEDGMKPEDLNMTESPGLTLRKAVPLMVIPIRAEF